MGLCYRLHRDEDLPELQRLWEESTDWGALPPELWRKYMLDAPSGGAILCVATDGESGPIVGGLAFVPFRVCIDGREVLAFRPATPILGKAVRSLARSFNPARHPVAEMHNYVIGALRERGHALVYMLPDPHWMLMIRMFPRLLASSFPLWSIPVPLPALMPLDAQYIAGPFSTWDERVDRLWLAASRMHGCSVVRDSRSLPWKAGPPEYEVLGVERDGELAGLVCSRRKGDRQWLICDLLAADTDALRATLISVCNLAHARSLAADPNDPIAKAGILVTPVLEPVLRSLGFQRDKYDFHLVVRILDESIAQEDVHPSRWYLSAND